MSRANPPWTCPAGGLRRCTSGAIRQLIHEHPNDLELATSAGDIRGARKRGKIAILMGIEGGHMLGNDLRMVSIYSNLGVRYMTLSHFHNNEWVDSSTDKPANNGLTVR